MFSDQSDSIIATAVVALFVSLIGASPSEAAPTACPAGIDTFSPKDGDLYVASAVNNLQRYRVGHGPFPGQPITLKPDDHISLYYLTVPKALDTPMVFALIRAYKVRPDYSTSLLPTEVHVSNSISRHHRVPAAEYISFHAEKRRDPDPLRTQFHMRFGDGLLDFENSYDDVSNPVIYALPNGSDFNGFKAYMQRISGFSADGRCVTFTLFNTKKFAQSVESVSMVLVALAEKDDKPSDTLDLSINFSTQP